MQFSIILPENEYFAHYIRLTSFREITASPSCTILNASHPHAVDYHEIYILSSIFQRKFVSIHTLYSILAIGKVLGNSKFLVGDVDALLRQHVNKILADNLNALQTHPSPFATT